MTGNALVVEDGLYLGIKINRFMMSAECKYEYGTGESGNNKKYFPG